MKRIIFIFTLMASTLTFASERVDSIIGYEFTTWYESGTMNSNEWRVQDSVFVYDENGNLTSKQTYAFYYIGGLTDEWVLQKSEDYVYNMDNQCIEHTRKEWKTGNGGIYEWIYDFKYEYTYENGLVKTEILSGYNSSSQSFQQNYKYVYLYNSNNKLIEVDTYNRDYNTSSFSAQCTAKSLYTYNGDGLLIEKLNKVYKSGVWKDQSKETYEYTSVGKVATYTYYNLKTINGNEYLQPYWHLQYTYNGNGDVVLKSHSYYNANKATWPEDQRTEYTYDEAGRLIMYIIINTNTSTGISTNINKWDFSYDIDGDLYYATDWDWDNSTNDWTGYRRYYYYHHGKPAPTYELIVYAMYEDDTPWTEDYVEPCTVTGSGRYAYNSQVSCEAICTDKYEFKYWMDGNISNPRIFTMNGNFIMWAYFGEKKNTAITSVSTEKEVSIKIIKDGNFYILRNGKTYNTLGAEVK